MDYKINFKKSAIKDLKTIDKNICQSILSEIQKLSENPRPFGYKKLHNRDNYFRIRINNYRVIYQVQEQELIISVIKIGHRKDVYS